MGIIHMRPIIPVIRLVDVIVLGCVVIKGRPVPDNVITCDKPLSAGQRRPRLRLSDALPCRKLSGLCVVNDEKRKESSTNDIIRLHAFDQVAHIG